MFMSPYLHGLPSMVVGLALNGAMLAALTLVGHRMRRPRRSTKDLGVQFVSRRSSTIAEPDLRAL
jgi:hypothetical protein